MNGEAIYGTRPIAPYKEGDVVFTKKGNSIYALVVPAHEGQGVPEKITLRTLKPVGDVTVLGSGEKVKWSNIGDAAEITLPAAVREMRGAGNGTVLRWEGRL